MNSNLFKKHLPNLVFVFLPLFLLITGWMYSSQVGFYHLFVTDPEYAFLFNGLNILQGHMPHWVAGPGTMQHLYCAMVTKVTHVLVGKETVLVDVLDRPDFYINIINKSIIIITFLLLVLVGASVKSVTGSYYAGLFIQLMPYNTWQIMHLMQRILFENFIIIGLFLLVILVFCYVYKERERIHNIDFYLVAFSVVIGFIAASKLMYLPIAIIPFLLIETFKRKLLFVSFSILAFCVFGFAIFWNWVTFRDWYIMNLIHSGQYGAGSASFIEFSSFLNSIILIFSTDWFYLKGFIFVLFGTVIYYLPFLKLRRPQDKEYKVLLGIAITMVIMTILVAKQFKFYYLTTALLLQVPGIYFVMRILTRPLKGKLCLLVYIPITAVVLYYSYLEIQVPFKNHKGNIIRRDYYLDAMAKVDSIYIDKPTLVIPNYYGVPYKAYGLFFGMAWCGPKAGAEYAVELKEKFPDIYFYHGWNNLFNQWGESFSYIQLLQRYNEIILFTGDIPLENSLRPKLYGVNRQFDTEIKERTSFDKINAQAYTVGFDSVRFLEFSVYCDVETADSALSELMTDEGIRLGNAKALSDVKSKSGMKSLRLDSKNPYGFTGYLSEVQLGEKYRFSVWRSVGSPANAGIAVMTDIPDEFFRSSFEIAELSNGWEKLVYELEIPIELTNKDIKFFCWNSGGETEAYFDDFRIERIK